MLFALKKADPWGDFLLKNKTYFFYKQVTSSPEVTCKVFVPGMVSPAMTRKGARMEPTRAMADSIPTPV